MHISGISIWFFSRNSKESRLINLSTKQSEQIKNRVIKYYVKGFGGAVVLITLAAVCAYGLNQVRLIGNPWVNLIQLVSFALMAAALYGKRVIPEIWTTGASSAEEKFNNSIFTILSSIGFFLSALAYLLIRDVGVPSHPVTETIASVQEQDLGRSPYWSSLLLSGLGSAFLASAFTHWIETRKEKKFKRESILSYLSLVEIDLLINSDKEMTGNTDYMVDGLRTFLRSNDIGAVNKELVGALVKLLQVMELFNKASEPFQNLESETKRVNMLNARCVATVNKQFGISAGCKNEIPQKLKPKIDEIYQLLRQEVARQSKLGTFFKRRYVGMMSPVVVNTEDS